MNKKPKTVKSRSSATNTLKRFFSKNPNAEELNFGEIVEATGRNSYDREKNMAWLSNKWPALKFYDFIQVEYAYGDGPRKFKKIVLLPEGKRALNRPDNSPTQQSILPPEKNNDSKTVTPESVYRDVVSLRQQNPSFDVIFEFKPKEGAWNK
jgi:hypothetical protein